MSKKSVKPLIILLSFFLIGSLTCLKGVQSQDYIAVRSTEIKPVSSLVISSAVDTNTRKLRSQFNEGLAKVSKKTD